MKPDQVQIRYKLGVLRDDLLLRIQVAVAGMADRGLLPGEGLPDVEIADPRDPSHGDFACNFALVASKKAGKSPREVAEELRDALLGSDDGMFEAIEVAGPGFLNIRLKPALVASYVPRVLEAGLSYGRSASSHPLRINVEYVSVNPNGPITIGSGRGAAFGSTLSNVLEAAGNEVHREYYINDGVNSEQMRLFAESVRSSILGLPLPENGYKGDYVAKAGQRLITEVLPMARNHERTAESRGAIDRASHYWNIANAYEANNADVAKTVAALATPDIQFASGDAMTREQASDLSSFGVEFDTWFSEQSLHDAGSVPEELAKLEACGAADTEPVRRKLKLAKGGKIEDVEIEAQVGKVLDDEDDAPPALGTNIPQGEGESETLWLRSTKFGDDMDRVLRRKDGRLTYIASDIAYHKDKFNRPANADKLITVLGPDHHGYIGRLTAVVAAVELAETGLGARGTGQAGPAPLAPLPPGTNIPQGGGNSGASTRGGMEATEPELTEIEAKLYASPEERDACQAALEKARKELEVVIFQLVRFVKDGKPAPMRKRDGNIYALIDLIKEIGQHAKPNAAEEEQLRIGRDVARFFYLMRSHDTTFDFDLNLAEKQSDENPVFYVQYAHARICSLIEKAKEAGLDPGTVGVTARLTDPRELALIKKICELPHEVRRCAEDHGVHRLTTYATELARAYHYFYDGCRVIEPENPEMSQARLSLCVATRVALRASFQLLGISAPERMDREVVDG